MAKRKINAAMLIAAGEDAHLQTNDKVSHAKLIDGQEFLEIEIDKIENNPMQPRIHIDENDLNDLARSIKLHGLIHPISVIRLGEKNYILKAGQRRLLVHKNLGLTKIKAIVEEESILPRIENEKALFEIAVMENTHRDNLNPLEFALSLRKALDKKLYNNLDELSMAISKSKSYVSKALKILSLNDEIIADLTANNSTNDIEALYEIQKIADIKEQSRVYKDFVTKKIDRKGIRELQSKVSHAKPEMLYKLKTTDKKIELNVDITSLEKDIKNKFKQELEEVIKRYI